MPSKVVSALLVLLLAAVSTASAALPPEVKRELSQLSRDLRGVTALVRKNDVDEAKAVIAKVEERLAELEIPEDERDRSYTSLMSSLSRAKLTLPVSFEQQVAPIIKDNCLRCHGAGQASANLRMDTYANMGRGGKSGPLLIPRNPQRSLIMARLVAREADRMPRGGDKLSDDELNIIGRWIAGGAAFDGQDVNAEIGTGAQPPKPKIKVVMADGSETVSFKDDVAPWMVNVCLGCHSGNNARSGFNITTFEQLLAGGDTGSTIVPGDPDNSYIVDLVLRQDPIKMPAGNQVRIKRSQAMALETWIKEGAHFDGPDSKATLRSMVPTAEELEIARLAAMSVEEFSERRIEQAETLWRRAVPREEPRASTSKNLYVYGDQPESRLEQIAKWGEEQIVRLKSRYGVPEGTALWRGRLIVFVAKTRFDYEEFNTVLLNRRTPRGVAGHVIVTPGFADAYVAMYDGGDAESADSLNAQRQLNSLLAQAFISRQGADLPDWLQQGFGILECDAGSDSEFLKQLPLKAGEALSTIGNPATLFDDGTFAPEEVGAVGYLLTRFLVNRAGVDKLGQLARQFENDRNAGRAVQSVYGQSSAILGQAFLQTGGR